MSDPIRSISQNNFILADQKEVSHDNTLSGNGTEASPLGLNETVLWDGNGTPATSANLSESVNNFEYIDFVVGHNEAPNLYRVRVSITGSAISISKWFMSGSSAGWIILATSVYEISNSGTTLSLGKGIHMWFSIDNFARGGTGTNGVKLYKVIGINRIANN